MSRKTHSDVGLGHSCLRHSFAESKVAELEVVLLVKEDCTRTKRNQQQIRAKQSSANAPFSGLMSR